MTTVTWSALPVLDLGRLNGEPAEREGLLEDVRRSAYDLGFFYVSGHGVSQALIGRVLELSRRFFALPEADKLAIEMINSPHFRGYKAQTSGRPRCPSYAKRSWRTRPR